MKNMGLSFEIPNKYGTYLSEILNPLPYTEFQWLIEDDEIYKIINGEFLDEGLFHNTNNVITGNELYKIATSCSQYLIFVTLRAFNKKENIVPVGNYQEFLDSDCQIILGVYDCSYVMLWFKNTSLTSLMFNYIQKKGFNNLKYITEYELIKGKYRIV
ncbi:DUF2691 family protein [Anaerocolumna chitinilytica]|uniref:DUF2691 family protein n=1 Tax=Anaerocolumna chitinilytica TaxID=1727145 RepID=A0A7I8DTD8_9FIRM|nr:DUF2691 family protein [Anaerocolumna chitinilytica]BCK00512.1 hypothetical protein bsdcttw_35520 [Anaerocolumna chitinilytica]